MNTIENTLDTTVNFLNKLDGLPATAVVLLSCIVIGYILKCIKAFPNSGIPVAVILWGGAFNPLLADLNSEMGWRVWFVKNLLVGLVLGFVAWLVHNQVIARFEAKFSGKEPSTLSSTNP
jgi:uncharacterized integral membrane protein